MGTIITVNFGVTYKNKKLKKHLITHTLSILHTCNSVYASIAFSIVSISFI